MPTYQDSIEKVMQGIDKQIMGGDYMAGAQGVPQELQCEPSGIIRPDMSARRIVINKAVNGFICEVGCKVVVFETKDKLLKELSRYLDNPRKVESEYLKKEDK